MDLIVGNVYYWLSSTEYQLIVEIYTNLASYFQESNGYYYCGEESLEGNDELRDLLLDYGLLQTTLYSLSSQPGGNV